MMKRYTPALCVLMVVLLVGATGCAKSFHASYEVTFKYDMRNAQKSEKNIIPSMIKEAMNRDDIMVFKWATDLRQFGEEGAGPVVYWRARSNRIEVAGKGNTQRLREIVASLKSSMRKHAIKFKESGEYIREPFLEI